MLVDREYCDVRSAIAPYTPEEYLAREREAFHKSEYLAGAILPRASVDAAHAVVSVNLIAEIGSRLKGGPCRTYCSDMKVETGPTGLFAYPDLSVVCGEPVFHDAERDVVQNPILIVEVLSPSTEGYDRGEKFAHYRRLASLQDYLLVSTREPSVERYTRQTDGQWLMAEVTDLGGSIALPSLGIDLPLAEVYDRVEFDPPQPVSAPENG